MGLSSFAGSTALVTGASMGLGAEVARQLAARGAAQLVLVARSEDLLTALATQLREQHGCKTHVLTADLSEPGAAELLHAQTKQLGLTIDLLVNNAGFGKWGNFEARPLESARSMIGLNVQALVDLTHLYGADMLAAGRGAILNVSSLVGFLTVPYVTVYAATKAFVTSFSEGLWAEWRARGVTVTCLCPGATESGFHRTSETYSTERNFMPAEGVMRRGLDAVLRGKPTVFASFLHSLIARVPHLLTRRFAAAVLAGRLRPPPGWQPESPRG